MWKENELKGKGQVYNTPFRKMSTENPNWWAGAAGDVAHGIDLTDDVLGSIDSEISEFTDEGNRIIFEDVFPKLKSLLDSPVLKGKDAYNWDANTLAQEQWLVTSLYRDLSTSSYLKLEVVSSVFGFVGGVDNYPLSYSLQSPTDRWAYGMKAMDYIVNKIDMPQPTLDYILPIRYYIHK
jgi:hypothetical protein